MTHLTMNQILQFVDGTADYASQAQSTSHLAVCPRCRREVELQKRLVKTARQNRYRTSARFTERVIARVAPGERKSWSTKILDNLAGVFAMMLVLGLLGYAVSSTTTFQSGSTSELSSVTKSFSDGYAKFKEGLQQQAKQLTIQVSSFSSEQTEKIVLFAFITLFALAIVDRFVLRQMIKTRL